MADTIRSNQRKSPATIAHRGMAAVMQSSRLVQGSRNLFDQSQSLLDVIDPAQLFHRDGGNQWTVSHVTHNRRLVKGG
jgi:hypothetical protein